MSLVWFRTPRSGGRTATELAAHLAPFGVVLRRPQAMGCVVYRSVDDDELVKEVGELVVARSGVVYAAPRRDALERDVRQLLCCAELALRERPSRASGWVDRRNRQQSWWRCTILRSVDERDVEASAFRSAEQVRDAALDAVDGLQVTP